VRAGEARWKWVLIIAAREDMRGAYSGSRANLVRSVRGLVSLTFDPDELGAA
jgi:hypothetical protein